MIQIDRRRVFGANRAATALGRGPGPRGIDEDAAHDLRRQREEVDPIAPLDIVGVDQPKVDLVDERGALERHARALVPHMTSRLRQELLVDERRELFERVLVPIAPCLQQAGDVR